jgi:hypothetical protein
MSGVVGGPTFGPRAALREDFAVASRVKTLSCPDRECDQRVPRQWKKARASGGLLLLGAVITLVTFAFSTETKAQGAKTPPVSGPKAKIDPKELYGDQGGEKVAAANGRAPNLVMRARLEDTFLKLSNPRLGQKKLTTFLVDYEVVSRGKFDGGFLVLHTDDGGRAEVALKSIIGRDNGTIELGGVQWFGNVRIAKNTTFPDNIEFYVVRVDERYETPMKFMVSNSLVKGKIKAITRARDWTAEEITRSLKPLAYKNPNAHAGIGEDVPSFPAGPNQFRYVDPDGRLLGLDYDIVSFDNKKMIAALRPVYSAEQPKTLSNWSIRLVARKGYAVAGAEVDLAENRVSGIRLLYRRVKPDGTFDAKDSYSSDWIAEPAKGETTKLVDDGRRVWGIHYQSGVVVNKFALVAPEEKKAEEKKTEEKKAEEKK